MQDFFISYNKADRQWAEWIGWQLEAAGKSVVIQAWDFRPGGDFVMEMQKAATGTRQTIAVLSDAYLQAEYTQPEWGNAFARDPQGNDRTLLPVRVATCRPEGLLKSRIYVDLVGLSQDEARATLLEALEERGKPDEEPEFPGSTAEEPEPSPADAVPEAKTFPGQASKAIDIWREKLEFLREQEAIVSDAAQKFALTKHLEEAEQKIQELGDHPS